MAARTTVICAAWSGDPERHALLEAHGRNLDAQRTPCERIYVFDAGDLPPPGLRGQSLAASAPLTIYEAWNLALALVRTPYVANLNLDDRLAPDALARFEEALDGGADLVAGDWAICFSQAETDLVQPCRPAESLAPRRGWPPPRAPGLRLGSAAPDQTLGPACAWRMSLHGRFPRYPWKLDDGTRVRVIGDWLFWGLLRRHGKAVVRLPLIVGNYHSHPRAQAEFRYRVEGDDLGKGTERCCEPG